jgi:hemin uptake protein HemP
MNASTSAPPPKPPAAPDPAPSAATTGPLRIDSATLMGGQRVLEIVHLGEVYRLQTTRLGKLILIK